MNSNYVYLSDSLTSLSERLVGPFNVEMTVEPISIKISDAIMNFQESGFQVAADFNQLSIINVYPLCQKCTPSSNTIFRKGQHQFLPGYYFPVNLFTKFEPNVDSVQS